MSLRAGVQIGGFAVLGPLGRGGMGEVYRGRDSRLKREVALKVLPEAFAADPERVARFQREAEILATLSHPHIAAIYGLEEADGVRALVMELVEGPTLAERIGRGPIPVDEALAIARQIVEALDYAHERGVLHRDLKPANIKVTPGGEVKLLDFGLAKALTPQTPGAEAAPADGSPTITSPAFTHAGTILGTAAYMAPEQVRGKAVDRRADIWAFGCVLYEMLTGTRAFQGETTSDTLAAVLKGHPDWTKLPRSLPASPRRLVEHCLERDQKGRLRDIADARLLLEDTGDVSTSMPAPARIVTWARVALGAFVAAALVAAGWLAARGEPPAAPGDVRRLTVQLPVPLSTSSTGGGSSLDIAPNGSAIAYTARGESGASQV